jgi:hypothetical protein
MEQHRRVVEALLELNDSTRTSILLRYLEGLAPRDIAARSGEPVETVRTRIKRGLATLRSRLDEREGGRGAWAAMLAPLTDAASNAAPLTAPTLAANTAGPTTGALLMTIQTKVALGVALALIAGLAWKALKPAADLASDPSAPVSPPLAAANTPGPNDADAAQDPSSEHRAAVVTREVPERASTAPVTPMLSGSVLVLDADGVEHAAEDGSFTMIAGEAEIEVAVEAGRFALARPEADAVRVGFMELGGQPAFLPRDEVALPGPAMSSSEEGPLELVATRSQPSVLRVVDARTGVELDDLTVLRGITRTRDAIHPGWNGDASAVFARGASSPLELSAFAETEDWWVRAPGYTWGWARFDHRTGGEREVPLEPGGADLEVRLDGFDPGLNLWLHVFPAGWDRSFGSLSFVRHPEQSTVVFEGLPPGPLQVRAELGIWHDGPRELAREELELLSGVRSEVVLYLEQDGALPAAVPLAGLVVLPASHPELDFSFEIRPLEGAALRKSDRVYKGKVALLGVPGQPLARRFDAGLVTPGRYLFVSSSLQVWEPFDVGPSGAQDVVIELPEVGEVRVRVVDEATGERLASDRIAWSAVGRPSELDSWTLASVDVDPGTQEYVFTAPLREISLSVRWDEYARAAPTIDVGAGVNVHEVAVRRLPGAWMRLVDGEATVPFEWGWKVGITSAGGSTKAKARITRIEGGRAWVAASEAGTYVVELPSLVGFRSVVPLTLKLGPGGEDEVVVDLERR